MKEIIILKSNLYLVQSPVGGVNQDPCFVARGVGFAHKTVRKDGKTSLIILEICCRIFCICVKTNCFFVILQSIHFFSGNFDPVRWKSNILSQSVFIIFRERLFLIKEQKATFKQWSKTQILVALSTTNSVQITAIFLAHFTFEK